MPSSRTTFVIPVIPEPTTADRDLYAFQIAVKDAINQLTTSLNTLASSVSWL